MIIKSGFQEVLLLRLLIITFLLISCLLVSRLSLFLLELFGNLIPLLIIVNGDKTFFHQWLEGAVVGLLKNLRTQFVLSHSVGVYCTFIIWSF